MIKIHCRGCWLFIFLLVSSLSYSAALFVVEPMDWLAWGLLYLLLLFLGMYISTQIDTKFDEKITVQELRTLQIKRLSDVLDPKLRQQIALKIERKTSWVKAWVSLFVGIVGGLALADYYAMQVPGFRLSLLTSGLAAFGPVIFLNILRAVIRFDYKSVLSTILREIASRLDGKGKD